MSDICVSDIDVPGDRHYPWESAYRLRDLETILGLDEYPGVAGQARAAYRRMLLLGHTVPRVLRGERGGLALRWEQGDRSVDLDVIPGPEGPALSYRVGLGDLESRVMPILPGDEVLEIILTHLGGFLDGRSREVARG